MAGQDVPIDITIDVERSLQPFRHVEQEVRDIFARHTHEEEFLQDKHATMLVNFAELKALGLHPLLEWQTNELVPLRWVNCTIRAKGTVHWINLFMRNDNLYVRGFQNQHKSYEMTEKAIDKATGQPIRSILLPPEYNCVLVDWDVKYSSLFGYENDDLEEEFQRITKDPDFVFDAVCFLSNYVHTDSGDNEEKAKKKIGGIIFILCEFLRMKMFNSPARLVDKAHHWGDICIQLLKWRDRDFKDWITSKQYPDPTKAPPKMWCQLKRMGINSEDDALNLIYLVLNRAVGYFANLEKNKSRKTQVSEKGEKGNQRRSKESKTGTKKWGTHINNPTFNPTVDSSSRRRFTHGAGKSYYRQGAPMEDGANSLPWGRRRVQLLSVRANFGIDAIDFHDWHRPQAIFRRQVVDESSQNNQVSMPLLALVGPRRPIGAYAGLGVEIFPTKPITKQMKEKANQRVINHRGAILEFWEVDTYADQEPSIHTKDINGLEDGEKLSICYMLVPDAVETRVGVELLLEGDGTYQVSGSIKAWNTAMGNEFVELFSHQTVKVSAGQWTPFPLLVSLLCLPNAGEVELNVAAYLHLFPCSNDEDTCLNSEGPEEKLLVPASECLKLSQTVARGDREFRGHRIAMTVNMTS